MNKTLKKIAITPVSMLLAPCAIVFSQVLFELAFAWISRIPVLGKLLRMLFIVRGDSPSILAAILSICIGYFVAVKMGDVVYECYKRRNGTVICTGISVIIPGLLRILMSVYPDFSLFSVLYGAGIIILGVALIIKSSDGYPG